MERWFSQTATARLTARTFDWTVIAARYVQPVDTLRGVLANKTRL
jgi:hypothetical protein